MESVVVQKLEKLQAALEEIQLETSLSQEETKEAYALLTKLGQLRENLLEVVDKVVREMELRVKDQPTPHHRFEEKIDSVRARLIEKKNKWVEREQLTTKEGLQALQDIQEI